MYKHEVNIRTGQIWHIGRVYHGFKMIGFTDNSWFEVNSISTIDQFPFMHNEWYVIEIHSVEQPNYTWNSYYKCTLLSQAIKDIHIHLQTLYPDLVNIIIGYTFDLPHVLVHARSSRDTV